MTVLILTEEGSVVIIILLHHDMYYTLGFHMSVIAMNSIVSVTLCMWKPKDLHGTTQTFPRTDACN